MSGRGEAGRGRLGIGRGRGRWVQLKEQKEEACDTE